jgi:hypothetical protein
MSRLSPLYFPRVLHRAVPDPLPEQRLAEKPKRQAEQLLPQPTDPRVLADEIVRMGRVRRGEIPYRESSGPADPLAQAIVAATEKARSPAAL